MIVTENKPLYELLYVKNDRLGFTKEQDLKFLYSLYPEARSISIIFSAPGEAQFVVTYS